MVSNDIIIIKWNKIGKLVYHLCIVLVYLPNWISLKSKKMYIWLIGIEKQIPSGPIYVNAVATIRVQKRIKKFAATASS